jgi:hypothetical protein
VKIRMDERQMGSRVGLSDKEMVEGYVGRTGTVAGC